MRVAAMDLGSNSFHLLVADVHVTSHGALTVAGLICLAVGAIMLFQNAPTPYHTSKPLVITIAVVLGGIWAFAVSKAWSVRHKPVEVSPEVLTRRNHWLACPAVAARRRRLKRCLIQPGEQFDMFAQGVGVGQQLLQPGARCRHVGFRQLRAAAGVLLIGQAQVGDLVADIRGHGCGGVGHRNCSG